MASESISCVFLDDDADRPREACEQQPLLVLTVDQARAPAASRSGGACSCIPFPSSLSMSSADTPLACRKTTFFSRGASRIFESSKKRDACSSSSVLFASSSVLPMSVVSATGTVLSSAAFSGFGSCSPEGAAELPADVRCQAGIDGFDIVTLYSRAVQFRGKGRGERMDSVTLGC